MYEILVPDIATQKNTFQIIPILTDAAAWGQFRPFPEHLFNFARAQFIVRKEHRPEQELNLTK